MVEGEIMSKVLGVVKDDEGSIGVEFYSYCKTFKVRIIAKHTNSVALFAQPYFPQTKLIYPKYKIIFPRFIPWIYIKDLNNLLKDMDAVVTLETYSFLSRQCANICERKKKPLITLVFETIPNIVYNRLPPYFLNTKLVVKNTNLFIALTKRAKLYLNSLSVPEEKIRTIYFGINSDEFRPPKEKSRGAVPRILFVGKLSPEKGLPDLLDAFSRLHKKGMQAELWICGRGPLEPLIKKYSRSYPINYLGFLAHEKLPEVYRQCDIFCLPSRDKKIFGMKIWEEQFGFSLIEAMMSGLPIVTTECGAIPEVVGSENIIVHQGSISELSSSLKELIRDESRRVVLGKDNRKRAVRLFNIKKQSRKFEEAVMGVLT
jgi:glycosyltransferase involved in cell wall biosynthesis